MFKKSVKTGYIEIFQIFFLPSLLEESEKMSWKGHGKVIEFHSWISVWTMLFVHCKIAYFYLVTAEKWLVVSLPNFLTMRKTLLSISCEIFRWIRMTKLEIQAIEFCDFIKDFVVPSGLFVPCSLTVTSTWRPRLTAHCPIRERH